MGYAELKSRIQTMSEERGDFVALEDGYYYFFPKRAGGAISPTELRILADILDDKNKEWDETTKAYFSRIEKADQDGAPERGPSAT